MNGAPELLDGLDLRHFSPPETIKFLWQSNCGEVPAQKGVYIVLCPESYEPVFLQESPAGWYHGHDPNYLREFVVDQWVEGARILYIGKAGGKGGLRRRIRTFVKFGAGEPVAHRGGRLIWHLNNSNTLLIRWHELPNSDPREYESLLICGFRGVHGRRPFANLKD